MPEHSQMKNSTHLQIYSVGRENTKIPCDIIIPAHENSVSRPHIEITVTDDGLFYVVDVGSANGTFVFRSGRWGKVTQDYVREEEKIRLGTFETTIKKLLSENTGRKRQ